MSEPRIVQYIHCKTCCDIKTLNDKTKLAVGWTKEGLQVFCENCDQNIIDLDFKGQKMGLYKGEV